MSDNFTTNPGSGGRTFAADDVGGFLFTRIKLTQGEDGVAGDIEENNPLFVQQVRSVNYKVYADTSFVTGDSPVSHDVNTDLARDGEAMTMINDGPGALTVAVSHNGSAFSDEWTMYDGDTLELSDEALDTIRVTWVSDTAYRILVI